MYTYFVHFTVNICKELVCMHGNSQEYTLTLRLRNMMLCHPSMTLACIQYILSGLNCFPDVWMSV